MKFKTLGVVFSILILILIGGFLRLEFSPINKSSKVTHFVINQGDSVQAVAQRLADQGLIRQPLFWLVYLRLKGLDSKVQAGEYQLSSSKSLPELAEVLTHGSTDVLVTIPEGWRVEEIAEKLAKELGKYQDDGEESWPEAFIKTAQPQEGFLFPDTYAFAKDSSPEAAVEKMRGNFNQRITEQMETDLKSQGLTLNEVVNLASIVEREAKFIQDRPIVAGILLRRYREGTLLGADATVQYALGYSEAESVWWRWELTGPDLELASPYNTRRYPGLPPTPICNPGLEAIKAVIYPEETNYFYYLSDKKGELHYAVTWEEHQENVAKYL